MDASALFEALKTESSPAKRQALISQAIQDGIDLEQLRELLDYMDLVRASEPKRSESRTPGIWQTLVQSFRFHPHH